MNRVVASYAAIFALAATPLPAQIVRGRVTEMNASTPIPGALVSLLADTGETPIVSMLTSPEGEYAIRAALAGRYRIAVKRIGVRRFVSSVFELATGETRVLDVQLDAVALALPEVAVSGLCVTRPRDLRRVSSLWDEARTALQATEISQRDSLVQALIARHAGELDPPSLRVLFDWRSDARVLVEQPFTSLSGDSLSAVGYWRQLPGDSVEFLAPDASALASNAFIRDHCFGLANPPRNRPDLVGLSFVPSRDRQLADITGTIWLDARRFELRFIEFRYTKLPNIPNADRVGGEVHYSRLTSGAWIVDRWFIRMPHEVVTPDDWPRRELREEGGAVIAAGAIPAARLATVTGVLTDSAGRRVEGAVVRAIGTHRQALTGADGSFRFDSLPPGGMSIVAHTDGYDAMATLAASRRVDLQAGRSHRVDLRAPNAAALRREFCPPTSGYAGARQRVIQGILRVLMVDSATSVPLSGVRFIATWRVQAAVGDTSTIELNRQAMTDARGAATFCNLPIREMELSVLGPNGSRAHVMMITELSREGVFSRVVFGRLTR